METEPLPFDQAIAFINQCKADGKKILGIERLFLIDKKFILDPREIVDFSMLSGIQRDVAQDADAALAFIRSIATENSYFTVVIE